jgi:hypothetical protein
MKTIRPDVVTGFTDKVNLMHRQYPLSEPANAVVSKLLGESFQTETPTEAS